jgi:hypothetical protein
MQIVEIDRVYKKGCRQKCVFNPFKRNTEDPLIKSLVKARNLNLLLTPRADAAVGDVYFVDGGSNRANTPGKLQYLLDPPFSFPDITTEEEFADIEGKETSSMSISVAFEFLENFLNMLAPPIGLGTKVHGKFRSKGVKEIKFSFKSCTRDYVDVYKLGIMLPGHKFATKSASYIPGRRYYLVTGVVRSPTICITAERSGSSNTNVSAEVAKLASGSADVTLENVAENEIVFRGKKSLAIGVELYELVYDENLQELKFKPVERSLLLKRKAESQKESQDNSTIAPAFIGDEEKGDAFITVVDAK